MLPNFIQKEWNEVSSKVLIVNVTSAAIQPMKMKTNEATKPWRVQHIYKVKAYMNYDRSGKL